MVELQNKLIGLAKIVGITPEDNATFDGAGNLIIDSSFDNYEVWSPLNFQADCADMIDALKISTMFYHSDSYVTCTILTPTGQALSHVEFYSEHGGDVSKAKRYAATIVALNRVAYE